MRRFELSCRASNTRASSFSRRGVWFCIWVTLIAFGARPAYAEPLNGATDGAREPAAEPKKMFDLSFRPTEQVWIKPGVLLQARYTFNRREQPADGSENTSQFTVPRARLIIDGGITKYVSYRLRIGTLADGGASVEQAFADLHFGPIVIRGGIHYLPASAADNPAPQDLQALDYSEYGQQTGGGQAAGAAAILNLGDFRAQVHLSNGARTAFTELATALNSRIAITGRIEGCLFTRQGLGRFDTESSFIGSDFGLRLGAAAHWQKGDGTMLHGDLEQYTADLTLEGPGFNVISAGRFLRVNPPEGSTTHDGGFLVQVGGFVHERIELWARYDGLYSDGKVHAQPPAPSQAANPFHEFGAGINGYVFPGENLVKIQLDFVYAPKPINESMAMSSSNSGLLPTDRGSQWAMRMQLNLAI